MEEDYRKKEIDPNQLFLLSFLIIVFFVLLINWRRLPHNGLQNTGRGPAWHLPKSNLWKTDTIQATQHTHTQKKNGPSTNSGFKQQSLDV